MASPKARGTQLAEKLEDALYAGARRSGKSEAEAEALVSRHREDQAQQAAKTKAILDVAKQREQQELARLVAERRPPQAQSPAAQASGSAVDDYVARFADEKQQKEQHWQELLARRGAAIRAEHPAGTEDLARVTAEREQQEQRATSGAEPRDLTHYDQATDVEDEPAMPSAIYTGRLASLSSTERDAVKNYVGVESLGRSLRSAENALENVPGLLARVLDERSWRCFRTRLGQMVEHTDFETFVTTPPSAGLGSTMDLIERLGADDPDARAAMVAAGHPPRVAIIPVDDPERTAAALRRHFDAERFAEVCRAYDRGA